MQSLKELGVMEPHERIKVLANYSSQFEVDPKLPTKRYYRSGVEMLKMAQVYYDEGNLENAYVLYMKYMTLFLEKIRDHPDYPSVPTDIKMQNHAKIREVLPRTEKIKAKLLECYQKEMDDYIMEVNMKKKQKELDDLKKQQKLKNENLKPSPCVPPSPWVVVQPVTDLNNISYPDCHIPSAPPPSFYTDQLTNTSDNDLLPSKSLILNPPVDRTSKPVLPARNVLKQGLRNVIVPGRVTTDFLYLAHKNTLNNVETCGILAGKLEYDQLIITHVIVPKQQGTSDSCAMLNEEEIFDYQDHHNLITIGWIHTHPTQTAFLSSVDLHTHCPYQLLMPEAIAIVCAPKYNETGIFILTPGHGLKYISKCPQTGFHPHPKDPPLFMTAEHVTIENDAHLDTLDLRKEY